MRTTLIIAVVVLAWAVLPGAWRAEAQSAGFTPGTPIAPWGIPNMSDSDVANHLNECSFVAWGPRVRLSLIVWRGTTIQEMFAGAGNLTGGKVFDQWKANLEVLEYYGVSADIRTALTPMIAELATLSAGKPWKFRDLYAKKLEDVVGVADAPKYKACFDKLAAPPLEIALPFYVSQPANAELVASLEKLGSSEVKEYELSDFIYSQAAPKKIKDETIALIEAAVNLLYPPQAQDWIVLYGGNLWRVDIKQIPPPETRAPKCCNAARICVDAVSGSCTMQGLYCTLFSTKCN